MAATPSNVGRVTDAFHLLAAGLRPFVDFNMKRMVPPGSDWVATYARSRRINLDDASDTDPAFLLRVIADNWDTIFRQRLPRSVRDLVSTGRSRRNEWAHGKAMSFHDAQFTLSVILALLEAVDASEADQVRISLDELNHARYAKDPDKASVAALNVVDAPRAGLKPWRDVVRPHEDVSTGDFSVAEFAADLELVRNKQGSDEYRDPRLFFERTYVTNGLRNLLTLGVRQVAGRGGQPVINCQTNFGGGKTHSLIALYHLLSGVDLATLPEEIQVLVADAGVDEIPPVRPAVVVGNRFASGQAHAKTDGTIVNTIWGEIAWQLGGAGGYALVAESDRNRTSPGDEIRTVIAAYSPCLILIDEWVAYARELYGRDDLPGGTFDSQFGFAQTLTEAVKGTPGALLVVSIPASEAKRSAGDDTGSTIEVGGAAGREALERLTAVVSRIAESWQPASGDESFEIVRRRLFQPIEAAALADRDATADAFGELYRSQRVDFPSECSELSYVSRMKSSYPIHPEVFDRLYQEWSTVERFQRTRGVLRLMAATIHSLWASDDRSPMILPCSIPLVDDQVMAELAGKLPDYWNPVIASDIDGPGSHAADIDRKTTHLGQLHATRRVARTIFIGATPNVGSANRGIEMDRIRLGCTFAGEKPGPIADALTRLVGQAPYLYVDRNRYWFDLQQNVNRTARDEAAQLLSGAKHEVRDEIVRRLSLQRNWGEFANVHVAPATNIDVADENRARLVILAADQPHIAKSNESTALTVARDILDNRGNNPRLYRNMLVFAAADQRALEGLEQAAADFLAWSSICERSEEMNLDAHQANQAKTRRTQSDEAVGLRLAEAYKYALVPRQEDPLGPVTFDVAGLDSTGDVAERVSRKMVSDNTLATQFPPVMLRQRLDTHLAKRWEDGDVSVGSLWEDFARYVYLPRLKNQGVLVDTVSRGSASTTWEIEGFAVADGAEATTGRYLGLVTGGHSMAVNSTTLVVKPEFALGQLETEQVDGPSGSLDGAGSGIGTRASGQGIEPAHLPQPRPVTMFRGAVDLNAERPVPGFLQINAEILDHLTSLAGATVTIHLDVTVRYPKGFNDQTIRTVSENARTLKFDDQTGFSEE